MAIFNYFVFTLIIGITLVIAENYNDPSKHYNENNRGRSLQPFYLSSDGRRFINRKLSGNGTWQYSGWRIDKLSVYYSINNCSVTRLECSTVDTLTYYGIKRWLQVLYNFDIWFNKEQREQINYEHNYPVRALPEHYNLTDEDLLINITFTSGHHNDGYPFDGKGAVVAHAFFPSSNKESAIHFDSDEFPKPDDGKIGEANENHDEDNISYYSVLIHELGHALGLAHSENENSTMVPYYKKDEIDVPIDDRTSRELLDIYEDYLRWAKYGIYEPYTPPPSVLTTEKPTTTTVKTSKCDTNKLMLNYYNLPNGNVGFDHILITYNNILFIKGEFIWVMDKNNKKINNGYPISIKSLFDFSSMEQSIIISNGIDAIIQTKTFDFLIFIDDKIFKFNSNYTLYDNYPISFAKDLGFSRGHFKVKQVQKMPYDDIIYVFGESFFMIFDSEKDSIVKMSTTEVRLLRDTLCSMRSLPIY